MMSFRKQIAAAVAMVGGFAALFGLFPGPDGPWSKTDYIGAALDPKLLGYNYSGYYTTINFIGNAVTILFGCWAGALLLSRRTQKVAASAPGGASCPPTMGAAPVPVEVVIVPGLASNG